MLTVATAFEAVGVQNEPFQNSLVASLWRRTVTPTTPDSESKAVPAISAITGLIVLKSLIDVVSADGTVVSAGRTIKLVLVLVGSLKFE